MNLQTAVVLVLGSTLLETIGLILIENYSFIDAFYMSVITISTVGFGEVEPLTPTGRLFISIMILINIGVVAYALAAFSFYVIEGKLFEQMENSRMQNRVNALRDHTIICGFGRYGREVVRHLIQQKQPFVIIEENEEKFSLPEFEDEDLLYVIGDATRDEILVEAGVAQANSLITALNDDSDNLFIVLSAKELNAGLRIVSRAHQARSRQKLRKAGANHVIMPEQIGGFYMATLISKPGAVEFFSYVTNELDSDIGFEEIRYDQLPDKLRGKQLLDLGLRLHSGVNVIGHRLTGGKYDVNPSPETIMEPGGSFIAVGSQPQILALRKYLKIT
ncbi:potassium channel family protein [Neolewinella persica]|uniref:potassium channel family protein n=1 Tax=Neolewinella persica TaxID=70998 RepID=UPI0012F71B6D|nr:potassium channel protein [Neolewinella persica]